MRGSVPNAGAGARRNPSTSATSAASAPAPQIGYFDVVLPPALSCAAAPKLHIHRPGASWLTTAAQLPSGARKSGPLASAPTARRRRSRSASSPLSSTGALPSLSSTAPRALSANDRTAASSIGLASTSTGATGRSATGATVAAAAYGQPLPMMISAIGSCRPRAARTSGSPANSAARIPSRMSSLSPSSAMA